MRRLRVPEEVKILKAETLLFGLQHGDFSKFMMHIDLPNGLQTFLPSMREESKDGALLKVLVLQAFLQKDFVICDQQGRLEGLPCRGSTKDLYIFDIVEFDLLVDSRSFLGSAYYF